MQTLTPPQLVRRADPSLARFFVNRLDELTLKLEYVSDPKERATLSVACFSTYLDCLALGMERDANTLIACLRSEAA